MPLATETCIVDIDLSTNPLGRYETFSPPRAEELCLTHKETMSDEKRAALDSLRYIPDSVGPHMLPDDKKTVKNSI